MTIHTADIGDLTVTTLVNGTWRENCYIVSDRATKAAIVFDPGDEADLILSTATSLGVTIERILLTHAHFDHVGAARALVERIHVPCEVHVSDQRLLRRAPLYAMSFEKRRIELPESVTTFETGAEYRLASHVFRVISTPGHTPGSVCFVGDTIAISGDTVLREAVGRTDLPGGDRDALVRSVGELLARLPEEVMLFAGHGAPWSVREARVWWSDGAVAKAAPKGGSDCGESS